MPPCVLLPPPPALANSYSVQSITIEGSPARRIARRAEITRRAFVPKNPLQIDVYLFSRSKDGSPKLEFVASHLEYLDPGERLPLSQIRRSNTPKQVTDCTRYWQVSSDCLEPFVSNHDLAKLPHPSSRISLLIEAQPRLLKSATDFPSALLHVVRQRCSHNENIPHPCGDAASFSWLLSDVHCADKPLKGNNDSSPPVLVPASLLTQSLLRPTPGCYDPTVFKRLCRTVCASVAGRYGADQFYLAAYSLSTVCPLRRVGLPCLATTNPSTMSGKSSDQRPWCAAGGVNLDSQSFRPYASMLLGIMLSLVSISFF